MYLPSRVIGTAVVLRSLLLWAGIRAASVALGGAPLTVGLHSVLVIALVVGLARHDHVLLNEQILLGNTGVSRLMRRAFAIVPALIAEITLHGLFA